ncbi:uncharacterized protein LOC141632939 [Silene latifolia]|uniref:uncharacterized protein LOC141632939 n=1 Tax=Silene latifolia TaxID=37657 RepID=UPI003D76BA22
MGSLEAGTTFSPSMNYLIHTASLAACDAATLSLVLPDIIHENQGAFIKGRSILENVLMCQDIVKMYRRANASPKCLFKIDLQKIMTCIKTTSFTLTLNGNHVDYFKGKRDLRQGDHIYPLIFTVCMEYLTRTIKYATEKWEFQYHPLCKELKLTHLRCADDLLMFCKGTTQSVMLITRAFFTFFKTSGLSMSNNKSEVFFSGMAATLKEDIKLVTGFGEGEMTFMYLGFPIQPGRITKQ